MSQITNEQLAALLPLLDHALELPPPERKAWLAELRRSRPADAAEVEALLANETGLDALGFLSVHAGLPRAPVEAGLAGRRLGPYTLERPLGQGGMGTVWLASRSDGRFQGTVAIKFLNLALLDPVGSERFRREGTVLARLRHPNIAGLLDAGVTDGGQPYLVLEHVEGERIDRYAEAQLFSRDQRLQLFLEVLGAVAHAHANLIVHRDLKPTNILVAAGGRVKLLDFGLAKLLEENAKGAEATTLTDIGGRALTPEYAAPEQIAGGTVTTATDVYALGVLLYVLLTGRHPTSHGSRTPAEVIRALAEVEPARLNLGDLDTILHKALRKAPGERYQTVTAFGDDLERYRRHEPVTARAASLPYRAARFLRRNRAAVAVGLVVTTGLIGATIFSGAQMREARRQRDAAVLAKRRTDAQIEFQSLLMSEVGDRPITMREILDRARRALEQQYAGDPRFLGPILLEMSDRYSDLGDVGSRTELLARAESLVLAGRADEHLAEVRCRVADNLRSQGLYQEAGAAFVVTDSMLRVQPDPEAEVDCLRLRAIYEDEAGQGERSIAYIRRALAIKDSLGETGSASYLELHTTLGNALQGLGRSREAVAVQDRVIGSLDSSGRRTLMMWAVAQHDKALGLVELGETAEAERLFHEAVTRAARSDPAGRVHPQPLIHYAETALAQGHADSALKYFGQLFAQGVEDSSRYWQGRAAFGLARAQVRLGRLAEAGRTIETFRRLSANFPRLQSTDDQVPDVRILEGLVALAGGDTVAAHARFLDALRANGYYEGKRKGRLRPIAILVAQTALALGRPDTARRYAREARKIATVDSLTEIRSARVGEAYLIEGLALLAAGDTTSVRDVLRKALVALRTGAGDADERTRLASKWLATVEGRMALAE